MSEVKPILVKPTAERVDDRGTFTEALNTGRWASVLYGKMRAGAVMGNHYHELTKVFLFLTGGRARVVWVHPRNGTRGVLVVPARHGIPLPVPLAHAICYEEDSSFIMLKSRPYSPEDTDTYEYQVV